MTRVELSKVGGVRRAAASLSFVARHERSDMRDSPPDIAALFRTRIRRSGRAFELLVAFAPVAAGLLDPSQTAGGVARLIGLPLIRAGMQPAAVGGLLRIFRIQRVWIYRRTCRYGSRVGL